MLTSNSLSLEIRRGCLLIKINLIPFCLFWRGRNVVSGIAVLNTWLILLSYRAMSDLPCSTCCNTTLQKLLSKLKSQSSRTLSPSQQCKTWLSRPRPATYDPEVTVASGRQAASYCFLPGTRFQNIIAASAEGCRAAHPPGLFNVIFF